MAPADEQVSLPFDPALVEGSPDLARTDPRVVRRCSGTPRRRSDARAVRPVAHFHATRCRRAVPHSACTAQGYQPEGIHLTPWQITDEGWTVLVSWQTGGARRRRACSSMRLKGGTQRRAGAPASAAGPARLRPMLHCSPPPAPKHVQSRWWASPAPRCSRTTRRLWRRWWSGAPARAARWTSGWRAATRWCTQTSTQTTPSQSRGTRTGGGEARASASASASASAPCSAALRVLIPTPPKHAQHAPATFLQFSHHPSRAGHRLATWQASILPSG